MDCELRLLYYIILPIYNQLSLHHYQSFLKAFHRVLDYWIPSRQRPKIVMLAKIWTTCRYIFTQCVNFYSRLCDWLQHHSNNSGEVFAFRKIIPVPIEKSWTYLALIIVIHSDVQLFVNLVLLVGSVYWSYYRLSFTLKCVLVPQGDTSTVVTGKACGIAISV